MMNYDDTIERLAIAVASRIKTVDDYAKVYNNLNKIKNTNMYAMTMLDLVNKYTDQNLIQQFHTKVDNLVDRMLDNTISEEHRKPKKRKRTSLITNIVRIFKRGK